MGSLFRRAAGVIAAVAVVTALLVVVPGSAADAATRATGRIVGDAETTTSVAASQRARPEGQTAPVVLLVSQDSSTEALSAAPVAAALGGPMLLVGRDGIPVSVVEEIRRLRPDRLIIVGGTGTISARTEERVQKLAPSVERIAGSNRYGTSRALVRSAFTNESEVFIATGRSFANALVGGALAAARGEPLIAVDGLADRVPERTLDLVSDLGAKRVVLVGNPDSVSSGIYRQFARSGLEVVRLKADSASEMSAVMARRFPESADRVIVANTTDYRGAMAGLTYAIVRRSPLVLSGRICADRHLQSAVRAVDAHGVAVVGSPRMLRGLVARVTPCRSTTDPSSTWVVANKKNALRPTSYRPSDLQYVSGTGYLLRKEAATAFQKLRSGASTAGAGRLGLTSAYRSYATQKSLYAGYVASNGRTWADLHSARAGHSEHQTGFTVDVVACGSGCGSIYSFAGTRQQKWVAANAWRYGFVVRYEKGYTDITGYTSEPWHLRYVGREVAADYHRGGFHTLEQYFG
ncbi:D-alanyl-D-alanine carboxypeptidase family protein [Microbacterium sp. bgisy189]|uniref:D-alanyl-D-alanine carboxypeptidase family protein n=1 Tax=Microbacterium sp. bgisy189 TaxID=3413798 RepID=UPI003EC07F86